MKQMQIDEPIQTNNISIGIDFGTTNSVIAYTKDKQIQIIPDHRSSIIPSVIAFNKYNDEILFGDEAKDKYNDDNYVVISSIKRLIGKKFHEIDISHFDYGIIDDGNDYPVIVVNKKQYTVMEICTLLLQYFKKCVDNFLLQDVPKCTIGVPAHFDDLQRQCIKSSANNAGFNEIKILNEPTAAALAYGLDNSSEGIYMVYDLGGGTFDVSILKMQMGVFQVLSTEGDSYLGGDDIDRLIMENIIKKHNKKLTLMQCRKIKENNDSQYISDIELEQISLEIINQTILITQNTINHLNKNLSEFKGIILVGGSTKMPLVKKILKATFQTLIFDELNPDEIVGIGASIKAAGISSGFNALLLDVVPLSLGIETMGGVVEKLIYRNTPIPISVVQEFTTYQDNQTGIVIHVVQGEREMVKDCRSLAKFVLTDFAITSAGIPKILITFSVDNDGILSVSAKDKFSNSEHCIEIKPSYNLSVYAIVDSISSAEENIKTDYLEKIKIQVVINAKQFIQNLKTAMLEDPELLSEIEISQINIKIEELENLTNDDNANPATINIRLTALQASLENFVENRINKHLGEIIKGVDIKDLKL